MKLTGLAALLAALAASQACLLRDVTETWYIDASGGVVWTVQEHNVRSDAQSAVDRQNEESLYWLAVQQDRHDIVMGLRELGGDKARTVVLRGESPFHVHTEARFSGLDQLGQRMIAAIGTTGTSIVTRDEGRWEWTLVVRDPAAVGSTVEPSAGINTLLGDLNRLNVVLTSGTFELAEGFTISKDRRVASFDEKELEDDDQPSVRLRLVWK